MLWQPKEDRCQKSGNTAGQRYLQEEAEPFEAIFGGSQKTGLGRLFDRPTVPVPKTSYGFHQGGDILVSFDLPA